MDITTNYQSYILSDDLLTVVMPAYNEGANIYNNLQTTSSILSKFTMNYEILAVNDGSKDNTEDEIRRASNEDNHIRLVTYSPNKGKGNAIREGFLQAQGELIAFLDSDLELSPSLFQGFLYELEHQQADIVIGSKMHKDSKLNYPLSRKIMSFCYYMMLRMLFHLHTKDTQTGIKLFRRDTIIPIMENLQTCGYAFDIEILATANSKNKKIIEMPVEVKYTRADAPGGMRIRVKDIVRMFTDTIAIKKHI